MKRDKLLKARSVLIDLLRTSVVCDYNSGRLLLACIATSGACVWPVSAELDIPVQHTANPVVSAAFSPAGAKQLQVH